MGTNTLRPNAQKKNPHLQSFWAETTGGRINERAEERNAEKRSQNKGGFNKRHRSNKLVKTVITACILLGSDSTALGRTIKQRDYLLSGCFLSSPDSHAHLLKREKWNEERLFSRLSTFPHDCRKDVGELNVKNKSDNIYWSEPGVKVMSTPEWNLETTLFLHFFYLAAFIWAVNINLTNKVNKCWSYLWFFMHNIVCLLPLLPAVCQMFLLCLKNCWGLEISAQTFWFS